MLAPSSLSVAFSTFNDPKRCSPILSAYLYMFILKGFVIRFWHNVLVSSAYHRNQPVSANFSMSRDFYRSFTLSSFRLFFDFFSIVDFHGQGLATSYILYLLFQHGS